MLTPKGILVPVRLLPKGGPVAELTKRLLCLHEGYAIMYYAINAGEEMIYAIALLFSALVFSAGYVVGVLYFRKGR